MTTIEDVFLFVQKKVEAEYKRINEDRRLAVSRVNEALLNPLQIIAIAADAATDAATHAENLKNVNANGVADNTLSRGEAKDSEDPDLTLDQLPKKKAEKATDKEKKKSKKKKEKEEKEAEKNKKKTSKEEKKKKINLHVFVPIPNQNPVLFLPSNLQLCSDSLRNPICFRASLPPRPEKPFAVKIGDTFVVLEWEQADFDGVPVNRYDIYMKNESRLYSDWRLAPNAANIKSGGIYTRFTVNHLPIGVRTEFRIIGFNTVGCSPPSKSSVRVTPGENLIPLGSEHRLRRLSAGGPMAVLDLIEGNIKRRHEVLSGFRLLIAFAQKTGGYQRSGVQSRGCKLCIQAIQTFSHDMSVIGGALLVIGYCFLGAKNYSEGRNTIFLQKLFDESSIFEILERHKVVYWNNSLFREAMYWVKTCGLVGLPNMNEAPGALISKVTGNIDPFNIFELHLDEEDDDDETEN